MRGLFNIVFRIVSSLLGLLLVFIGGVWALQGLKMAPGALNQGMMVGDWHWTLYGAILALVGICQAIWSNTRQKG